MSQHKSKMAASNRFYGWTPSPPDHRDRRVSYNHDQIKAAPVAIDLSSPLLPAPFEPCWNQRQLGSCGPHSAAEDISYAEIKQDDLTILSKPSPLFIYWCTRSIMGTVNQDSGVDNRSMMKALAQFGWCDEELHPYSDTPSGMVRQPSQQAFDQAATRKIAEYLNVPQDINSIKTCLGSGDPFIFGFTVYESFESPQATATGVISMPGGREKVMGGHDVLMVGYNFGASKYGDIPPGYFKFKNHWYNGSQPWGANGYGFFPASYVLSSQLSGDFWTVRHSAKKPTPQPTPPSPPSPPSPSPVSGTRVINISGDNIRILVDGKPV